MWHRYAKAFAPHYDAAPTSIHNSDGDGTVNLNSLKAIKQLCNMPFNYFSTFNIFNTFNTFDAWALRSAHPIHDIWVGPTISGIAINKSGYKSGYRHLGPCWKRPSFSFRASTHR